MNNDKDKLLGPKGWAAIGIALILVAMAFLFWLTSPPSAEEAAQYTTPTPTPTAAPTALPKQDR